MPLALLLASAAVTAVGAASLYAVHGLRRQIAALRADLAAGHRVERPAGTAAVPAARTAEDDLPLEAIRSAVSAALADERERELAEARAFWAAQEARDAADAPSLLGGLPGVDDAAFFLPRQADFAGLEADAAGDLTAVDLDAAALDALRLDARGLDALGLNDLEADDADAHDAAGDFPEDSPELAAARRRHPSHPDFVPVQSPRAPAVGDHERTVSRLEQLAADRTALADVRPGPLGTLDVYVFADGTTLCMTPGHHETAQKLATAVSDGRTPVLLGGSGVSGAYALTFECGDDSVYVLADRVIASF
ncbi:hypothetical protein [Streptomyces sp. NPDC060194]|uniref:hypothetical protein n=1 Tax=Streptomyces sp. NPDC060194 TaxID=3347069 RepID=UPI0036668AFD